MTDHTTRLREEFPALADIESDELREQVLEAWVLGLERGGWTDVAAIPYAWNIHEVSNIEHVNGVVEIATSAAKQQRQLHGADPDEDVVRAVALLHDVGKCYEYVEYVEDEVIDEPDPQFVGDVIPHSLSGYALAHEVGCPLAVQQAIPHYIGEVPTRTLEAELVKSANEISSNAITQATMGITLDEWIENYSQTYTGGQKS